MVGRVADEVVLSDEERIFLEAQVRRHKAARALSDRCRMILLCAEGLRRLVTSANGKLITNMIDFYEEILEKSPLFESETSWYSSSACRSRVTSIWRHMWMTALSAG